jgi:hypothetical protein
MGVGEIWAAGVLGLEESGHSYLVFNLAAGNFAALMWIDQSHPGSDY